MSAMAIIDGRTWMEHLSLRECWELLESTPVGRIGVLVDSAPEIYPVNHVGRRADGRVPDRTAARSCGGWIAARRCASRSTATTRRRAPAGASSSRGARREVTSVDEERHLLGLDLRYWGVGPKPRSGSASTRPR